MMDRARVESFFRGWAARAALGFTLTAFAWAAAAQPAPHVHAASGAQAAAPGGAPAAMVAAHDTHAEHAAYAGTAPGADADGVVVDFELVDRHGTLVRDEDFRGRYLLLAFGFTNCPHICPLMAFNMGAALETTEHEAAGVFVSVDTERDTPAVSDDYATRFSARMQGLGGSIEQINAAARNFRVSYAVTKTQSAYTVQHTATIYLIDPDGQLRETFAVNASPADIVAAMR